MPAKKQPQTQQVKKNKDKKKQMKPQSAQTFKTYIHRIFKKNCPDNVLSKESLSLAEDYTHDLLDKMIKQINELAKFQKREKVPMKDEEGNLIVDKKGNTKMREVGRTLNLQTVITAIKLQYPQNYQQIIDRVNEVVQEYSNIKELP